MRNEKAEISMKILSSMKLNREEFYKSLAYDLRINEKGFIELANEFNLDLYNAYLLTYYEDDKVRAYINFDKNPDKKLIKYGISIYDIKEEFLSDNQKILINKIKESD